MTIRVGVFGAGGRMGTAVCDAVDADAGLELVAAVDPSAVGAVRHGITVAAEPKVLADAGAEVAIDFTVAAAARDNLAWCALHGVHAVVGTTGLGDDDLRLLGERFTRSNCLVAANFAISAVLMMRFAEMAAPFFDTAEIIELHHDVEGGRTERHRDRHRRADRRRIVGMGARPDHPRGGPRAPAVAPGPPASTSIRCACAAWSPTRR